MKLEDYIMCIPTLDGNTCKEIVTEIDKHEWTTHTFVYHDKVIQDERWSYEMPDGHPTEEGRPLISGGCL